MPSTERWLLRGVVVDGARTDCRLRDGIVAELAPGLAAGDGERVLAAGGGALVPGLADHHLHLRALAAARRSIDLGGRPLSAIGTVGAVAGDGLVRIIGAGEEVTRGQLDELFGDRPVRVQHRGGALWTLNTAALDLLPAGLTDDERRTGQFWRSPGRLRALSPPADRTALAEVGARLAGYGITHVTDASPDGDPAVLAVDQHVCSLAAAGNGPRKIVLSDHLDLDYAALVRGIRTAHSDGRPVAVHTVTAASLALLLAAFAETGTVPGDRVEHAAVCDDAAAARLAELDVVVVTQPTVYARHRAAFRRDSDPGERDLLWRYGGLLRRGVRVAISSDAPYGDPDPWRSIAAAATELADGERVPPATSVASLFGRPEDAGGAVRAVRVGEPADLCLLAEPLPAALAKVVAGGGNPVVATFIDGVARHLSRPASPAGGRR
jgi:predicted amidohydrolase YtcJ